MKPIVALNLCASSVIGCSIQSGETAMHIACRKGHVTVVKLLRRRKASKKIQNKVRLRPNPIDTYRLTLYQLVMHTELVHCQEPLCLHKPIEFDTEFVLYFSITMFLCL